MNDAQLIEHLHARGWSLDKIDVPMIREACAALQPVPTIEEAIASLKIALRDSKGWTMDYSDAIIRDAIDRTPPAAKEEPSTMQVVAYLRANKKGEPQWSEDCVCQDPIYPSDPDGSDSKCVSMAVVRLSDHLAAIKALEADRDSWHQQASDRLDVAVQCAKERDEALAALKALNSSQECEKRMRKDAAEAIRGVSDDKEYEALCREFVVDPSTGWGAVCQQFFCRGLRIGRDRRQAGRGK